MKRLILILIAGAMYSCSPPCGTEKCKYDHGQPVNLIHKNDTVTGQVKVIHCKCTYRIHYKNKYGVYFYQTIPEKELDSIN